MYGLTRATTTLLAAAVAGLLIWFATQINDHTVGGFWAVYGLIAGAGLVNDLKEYVAVFAFGIGLVFGFSFDTTGPRRKAVPVDRREAAVDRRAADEPLTAERDGAAVAPRSRILGRRHREPVGTTTRDSS